MERGEIHSPKRLKQAIAFTTLIYERGITPTDFDLVIDFGGEGLVIGEFKHKDAEVPRGQLICIERVLHTHIRCGVAVLGLVAEHNITDPNTPVTAANCIIRKAFFGEHSASDRMANQWISPQKIQWKVDELITFWRNHYPEIRQIQSVTDVFKHHLSIQKG